MDDDRTFLGLLVNRHGDAVTAAIQRLPDPDPAEGEVVLAVAFSGLNYKDALALHGLNQIVRTYPLVPGIDCAGVVHVSRHADFRPGDRVLCTGYGIGERQHGGLAQRACVRGDWLVPLPPTLDLHQAMALGTAGFTAMLCVQALERHGALPADAHDEVLVTGAGGGVGGYAVALLAARGCRVTAVTGRPALHDHLMALGATSVLPRTALATLPDKPLQTERWRAAIDTVGGATLAQVLTQLMRDGAVAACGLAGGSELPTTVFPFILRGVSLLGISSVLTPMTIRRATWQRLATSMPAAAIARIAAETVPLTGVIEASRRLLAGEVRGRVVVRL